MASKRLITIIAAVLTSCWSVQASAEKEPSITTYSPEVLGYVCRVQGGIFSGQGDGPGGGFYCLLPDGTLIACGPNNSCTVSTRLVSNEDLWQRLFLMGRAILEKRAEGPADLVAIPLPASTAPYGFCKRNNQGQLLIDVYNQGGLTAAASTTRVIFDNAAGMDLVTPAIAAGTRTQLILNIPPACFGANSECRFGVGLDAMGVVAEASETNNDFTGACGPQFQ